MRKLSLMFCCVILVSALIGPPPSLAYDACEANESICLEQWEQMVIAQEKQVAIDGHRQQILDKIEAKKQAELEAQREAERKEQERIAAEQEAKEKAQQANTSSPADPVGMAQWENNQFGDVHDRANYLVANPNHLDTSVNWSDSETLQYLQTLRDDLKTSGEMQLQAQLEGAF